MNQDKIKPVKATVETAFSDYPRSLRAMIKETINKAFDLLEARLDGVLAIYTFWNFEDSKNEVLQHFRYGPTCLNDRPHQFSVSFKLFKERIEIRLVPIDDSIDFEANELRKLIDTVFLQRAEWFDITTVLIIGTEQPLRLMNLPTL